MGTATIISKIMADKTLILEHTKDEKMALSPFPSKKSLNWYMLVSR
jgi:hypothetical protein